MIENFRELWRYRALVENLIGRELKVRYRGSVLGFLWTFLNPFLQVLVYSLVFGVYQRSAMENYSFFLFVGLLPWTWFATSMTAGTTSIADRRDLISKVTFPPQILPVTVVLSALANFGFALPIAFAYGVWRGVEFGLPLLALPLVVLVQLLLTFGLVYLTSTFNVFFRDVQHILGNLMTFWFFLTPIVYSIQDVPASAREIVLYANPMAALAVSYQSIMVHNAWPPWRILGYVALLAMLFLFVGSAILSRSRESFAEAA